MKPQTMTSVITNKAAVVIRWHTIYTMLTT